MLTQYNSIANDKSGARRKREKEISQLAHDSFRAFKPFINLFDCGLKGYDGPFHLITKEDWRLHARHKAGERGLQYENGDKFNPVLDVIRNIFSEWHVHKHIEEHETTYFTSGKKGLGLFYLDVDAHHPWQTDEYRAKAVLEKVSPSGYFRASNRGQNGYLKIRYQSIREFNEVANHLQETVKRLFLHLGILCDIEVKGTITHNDKSGSLAKLPFQNKCGCHMRDETDSWNYPQLEKFKACPVVKAHHVEYIARRLEALIDEEKVRQFAGYKRSLADREKESQKEKSKNGPSKHQPSKPPKPQVKPMVPTATAAPRPVPATVRFASLGSQSGDAFARNLNDIRPFVRAFWKEHRRFPTTDEALDWIKANNRYSGEWEDRESKRAKRVGKILAFTEQGFDPKKLAQGEHKPVSLKAGRFSWWVRQQFGSRMTAWLSDLRAFDPVAMTAPVVQVSVPARFVETFLAVADFCVRQDPLENKAVPTNRIKKLWEMVKGGAAWNQQYFQVVRDRLDRMGIIRIFDKKHRSGKAWRWEAGDFPSQDYREEQRKISEQSGLRAREAGDYRDLMGITVSVKDFKVHYSLYSDAEGISGFSDRNLPVRAPP